MSPDSQGKAQGAIFDGLADVRASSTRKEPATNAFRRLKVPAHRVECVRDFHLAAASESTIRSTASISIVHPSRLAAVIAIDDEPQLPDIAPKGTPTVEMDRCCSPGSTVESDPCPLDHIQSISQSTARESVKNSRSPSSRSTTTIDYQSPSARATRGSAMDAFRCPRSRITSPGSLKSSPASSKGTSVSENIEPQGVVERRKVASGVPTKKKRATTKTVTEVGRSAVVIKKTWLDMILSGQKTWEIRGANCRKRGLIRLAQSKLGGMIVGEVTITDCLRVTLEDLQNHVDKHCIKDLGIFEYKEIFAWVLSDARRFRQPQPYHHKGGAITWVELDAGAFQRCNVASARAARCC